METVKVGITETIRVLLEEKKFNTLRDILVTLKPYDIATIFEELQDEKTPLLFRILPKEIAAETFAGISSTRSTTSSIKSSSTTSLSSVSLNP